MADHKFLNVKVDDGIAVVTLNNPPVNALNSGLLKELKALFESWTGDRSIRAVVITGGGTNAFCAGADVNELASLKPEQAGTIATLGHETFKTIEDFPRPVVAAVNNLCLGGGFELALACDFRFASDRARFGAPEVTLGLIPGWGGTQRLPRLVGPSRAKEIILTGQMINAPEANRIGLVNKVLPDGDEVRAAMDLAKRIAVKSAPIAVATAKKLINDGLETDLVSGLAMELEGSGTVAQTKDLVEGLTAFKEKRQPKFTGE